MENYNQRIKHFMASFLSERGKTLIPWTLLLIFIKNEEHHFSEIIKIKL